MKIWKRRKGSNVLRRDIRESRYNTASCFFWGVQRRKKRLWQRLPEKEDKGTYKPDDAEQFISIGDYIKAMSIYKEMLLYKSSKQICHAEG